MGIYEESILELYDENQSTHQIRSIAKMYNADVSEVERILTENGRELPKPSRLAKAKAVKAEIKPEPVMVDIEKQPKVIPDAVKRLVFDRIDEIDKEINNLNQRIASLEEAKVNAAAEYKILCEFINVPFGAGNLSHESSDNMVESPQASA